MGSDMGAIHLFYFLKPTNRLFENDGKGTERVQKIWMPVSEPLSLDTYYKWYKKTWMHIPLILTVIEVVRVCTLQSIRVWIKFQ